MERLEAAMIGLILFETLLFGPLLWACLTSGVRR